MRIIPNIRLRVGEQGAYTFIDPGTPVELDEQEANYLVQRGFATQQTGINRDVSPTDIIEAIVDAIDDVPADAFNKEGKPTVKAIEDIIGQSVSAADRDHAWLLYQQIMDDG